MKIKFLKAFNGDAILLSFKEGSQARNILIDGGISATYQQTNEDGTIEYGPLKKALDQVRKRREIIDLLVLTHVDDDHIAGILSWLENDKYAAGLIGKVWFNSGRLISEYFKEEEIKENLLDLNLQEFAAKSIRQGVKFEDYIEENAIWDRRLIKAGDEIKYFGLKFTILSPTLDKLKILLKKWEKEQPDSVKLSKQGNDYALTLKQHIEKDKFVEDTAEHNGSSIAMLISNPEKNLVFLADANPTVIVNSLKTLGFSAEKPLKSELVKISHHGSKSNNSVEMFKLLKTKKYVISTNGDHHSHPHKQLLARLAAVNNNCKIYFNYGEQIETLFSKQDYIDFPKFKPASMKDNQLTVSKI